MNSNTRLVRIVAMVHTCEECKNVWHDRDYDSVCPSCWCGEYTTEYEELEGEVVCEKR